MPERAGIDELGPIAASVPGMRVLGRHGVAILAATMVFASTACGGGASDSPIAQGREIYGNICSACHGAAGQGGVGPALGEVASTFDACADHQRWVTLGSDRWKSEVGPTYGDEGKEVAGGMPSHAEMLTPEEIASVATFERFQYGGVELDEALSDCGFDDDGGT